MSHDVAYRGINVFKGNFSQRYFVIYVSNSTWFSDVVVGVLLRCHFLRLHLAEYLCVELSNGLICGEYFEKLLY